MPGTYIHPDTTRRFIQRHSIHRDQLPSLFFDSSVAVSIHQEPNSESTNSDLPETDTVPFSFYVAGVGDLGLSPCSESKDNATVVRIRDKKSPCGNSKLSLLFSVSDAPEVHIEPIDREEFKKPEPDSGTDRLFCSLRKVFFDSICAGYGFGVVGTFIDCFLLTCLHISTLSQTPLPTRLVFGFLSGFIIGNMMRPMVSWVRTLILPLFNRLGQLSVFTATRSGYVPLFWSEDLPEFIGFMLGAPLAEYYRGELGVWKGFVRSAIGSGIGSALGELYRHCSRYFRRATTTEIVLDRLLEELRGKRGSQPAFSDRRIDANLGFMLASGVSIGQCFWYAINQRWGISLRYDVLGQSVNYLCVILAYEIAKRCPGEPCNTACNTVRKIVRSWSKDTDLKGLLSQSDVDKLVKDTTV